VEVERFHACEEREGYYVVVSRLMAHKRVDVIVEAFSALGLPLKIIGEGPEKNELMRRAADNIEFLGFQPDTRVAETLSRARGFVCAAEEDFGIAMVEAQAAGCPVIAYGRGGALETVVEGRTGLFFRDQSPACLIETVQKLEMQLRAFEARAISESVQRFAKGNFKTEFQRFVADSQK
jgi:glycosyltransferase involved in cell wall biosynthesis